MFMKLTRILLLLLITSVFACCSKQQTKTKDRTETNTQQPNTITSNVVVEFLQAVSYGNLDKVKEMITSNPSIVNSQDGLGFSALHNLMCEEQFELLEYLIKKGADVNLKNNEGLSPIHLACYSENIRILLESGADIQSQDKQGDTPLHSLVKEGKEKIDVIEYLIKAGAKIDLKNKNGETPLDIAILREENQVILLLKEPN